MAAGQPRDRRGGVTAPSGGAGGGANMKNCKRSMPD
jgi:hypothetical protein